MADDDVEYALKNGSIIQDTYEILEPIGQGGMGSAYKARHIAMGHLVAVKVVNPNLTKDKRTLDLFKREANLLRELSQADPENAIVKIETLLQDAGGAYYLIMEYVDGHPLSHYTKLGAKLRDDDLLKFANRMIKALATIHSKNIIHRDISPDNIMVPNENILASKILDFGVATDTLFGEKSIIGDTFAGKLGYASPEQMGLFGGEVTAKSDLYSLGLVLLSTAGLKGPATADISAAVELRKQDYNLSGSKLSAKARSTIEALLKADPKDRHIFAQTGTDIATGSDDADITFSDGNEPAKNRNPLLFAAAAGAILVLGLVVSQFMISTPPQITDASVPEVQQTTAELATPDVADLGSPKVEFPTPSAPTETEQPADAGTDSLGQSSNIAKIAKKIFLPDAKNPKPDTNQTSTAPAKTAKAEPNSALPDPFNGIMILIDLGGRDNLRQARSALERVSLNTQYVKKQRARSLFMLARMHDPRFHSNKTSPDAEPMPAKALQYYNAAQKLGVKGLEPDVKRLGG